MRYRPRMLKTALLCALAVTACKKENKTEPAADKAAVKPVDKPADKPNDMTADKGSGSAMAGSDKPADKPAEPAKPEKFEPAWEKYTSKEGKFEIELPAKPEEQDQMGMKMVGAQFGVTAKDDRTGMCGVAYLDLPKETKTDAKTVKAMLDGSVAKHKASGKVVEEKDVKLDKWPGRSIVVDTDKHRKWMRTYVVEKRLYVLTCGTPVDRGEGDTALASKTLDSFKLVK